MSDTAPGTAVDAELAALAAPLREQLASLDAMIEEQTVKLDGLRATRMRIKRTLAFLDPDSVPKKQKGASKTTVAARVSPETVTHLGEQLRSLLPEINGNGGFTVTSLRRDHGLAQDWSQSTLQKAIAALHDRNEIRLDHRGRGGAHYYKVVA